jgi:drug/metabolite transporter (DMT)-like permease
VLAFQWGSTRLVDGHNPINFCNGLLFGNAFSLVSLLLIRFGRSSGSGGAESWRWRDGLRVLLPVACGALLEVGILIALSRIDAIRVAVVLTLTSVVLMVLDALGQRRGPRPLAILGVILVVAASTFISAGEAGEQASTAMAPMGLALLPNTELTNNLLLVGLLAMNVLYYRQATPLAEELGDLNFAIWQTALQTVIFLVWATTTFGLVHLYDLRSPLLWQIMLLYGAVLSTAYTLLESAALAKAGALMVALFEGLLPFLSGLFAWFLLQQPLTLPLIVGTAVIGLGIASIELAGAQLASSTQPPR